MFPEAAATGVNGFSTYRNGSTNGVTNGVSKLLQESVHSSHDGQEDVEKRAVKK